ncbi:MAG: hypothetical protein LKCHEGNO_02781 [Burkholderiaceae bacterium]|nr:hypothetical protein [Burkholderiaceae bacterium]
MSSSHLIGSVALIGIGATAVMDAWLVLLSRLGVPTAGFAMVGRWVGNMRRGQFAHAAIAKAPPVRNELGLGWLTHYVIGIAFAALLVTVQGGAWLEQPTFLPALAVGVATVAAPWFVMQPAMGSGVLASKTPSPLKNCLRNLANHSVFGAGLYVAAAALSKAAT